MISDVSDGSWRARIDTEYGQTRGAGVLVTPSQLLTCAHVVDGVDRVLVTFPGIGNGESLPATVIPLTQWKRRGDNGDVALVGLDGVAPRGAEPCCFAALDALKPRAEATSHVLRALGFPADIDANGTYVEMSSSSDRAVGGEWLAADVEAAHLQRVKGGFSGAGLYLPESGKVAGIITDAVLEDDGRGGYIGRMMPLTTIRRYWEAIDDLLPLPWMDFQPRAELREAVANATVTADLDRILKGAFPMVGSQDGFRSAWAAIRYVAESVQAEHGLATFLHKLAAHLGDGTWSRLVDWARRWAPEWVPGIAGAEARATAIVISLRTPTRNGKTHVEITARPRVDGLWIAPGETLVTRRSQLQAVTEGLVTSQVSTLRSAKFTLEFAVRRSEFCLPFDEWHYQEPGTSQPRPMRSVPLFVWDVERRDPRNVTLSSRIRERWETLAHGTEIAVTQVKCHLPYDYREFHDWLDADEGIGALAYASLPRQDWLNAALDIGIPVMLWYRRACAADGIDHIAHDRFLADIVAALTGTDPEHLPARVAQYRKAAMSPLTGGEDHPGRHLTLFWDDPGRLTDPPLNTTA